MGRFRSTVHTRSAEVLQILTEESNTKHTLNRRTANWIDHINWKDCLLKHVIQGKMKEMGGRGRNHKQLLDNINDKRFWKLKRETLDHDLWKHRSSSVEKSLQKMLWLWRKTDYVIMIIIQPWSAFLVSFGVACNWLPGSSVCTYTIILTTVDSKGATATSLTLLPLGLQLHYCNHKHHHFHYS